MPHLDSKSVLRGSLTGIILKLLSENGRMYGYEITKSVRTLTGGKLTLTEAALYPALHKLLEDGVLETESELIGGRVRKYYRIAKGAKATSTRVVADLKSTLDILQILLNGSTQRG